MTSTPNQLRSEGFTELVADIVIACTGGFLPVPGTSVPTATISVNLSVPVTSRILSNLGSEALLLVDEPGSTTFIPNVPTAGFNLGAGLPQVVVPSPIAPANSYVVGTASNGAIEACTTALCAGGVPNVFQGIIANGVQVVFQNVPILAPGSTGLQRIYRITNVRVNANQLASAPISQFANVLASVAITSTVTSLTPSQTTVGFASTGLSATSSVQNPALQGALGTGSSSSTTNSSAFSSLNFVQCTAVGSSATALGGAVLQFVPSFVGAFKTRVLATATNTGLGVPPTVTAFQNVPGSTPINFATFSESGLVVPVTGGSSVTQVAGLADFGTRLKAEFVNIPAGVNIYVTTSNFTSGNLVANTSAPPNSFSLSNVTAPAQAQVPIALLVLNETVPDLPNFVQSPGNTAIFSNPGNVPVFQIPLTNGAGTAVWEVVQEPSSSGNNLQNLNFGVYFVTTVQTASAALTGQVGLSYAPTPPGGLVPGLLPATGAAAASATLPIPRFADTSTSHQFNIVTVGLCQTLLLFPYVTNTSGFETGMSIANTSLDTVGTSSQSGTCTFAFFGNNIIGGNPKTFTQANVTTVTIPAGGVWADTLSHAISSTNSFTGYMFATCNFQFAHGFAFISDASATQLAEGYLALVVNNGTSASRKTAPGGEALNQ